MLTIPGSPFLDKLRIIGGCRRLPLPVDSNRLASEVASLPGGLWGSRGGRVGVHNAAEAVFLRGHAPAEGDLPIADRDALGHLPYAAHIIREMIPAPPMRCLLARLPAGAVVPAHVDRAEYFEKTVRIHIPVDAPPQAKMYCAGKVYYMRPGEVWALNNCTVHGVWNADPDRSRTHLICDFLPTDRLLGLLAASEAGLGVVEPETERRLDPHASAAAPA